MVYTFITFDAIQDLSGWSVSPLVCGPALWAMSSQSSETQRWSCGTLQDGVDLMDLAIQEQNLLQEIQATLNLSNLTIFKSKCVALFTKLSVPSPSWQAMDDELQLDSGCEGPKEVRIWGYPKCPKEFKNHSSSVFLLCFITCWGRSWRIHFVYGHNSSRDLRQEI